VIIYVIIASLAEMLLQLYWWDSSKFSLTVTSVIISYMVVFSATNMHIYHKVAIWHLMQAWARFALQCFSFFIVFICQGTCIIHVPAGMLYFILALMQNIYKVKIAHL